MTDPSNPQGDGRPRPIGTADDFEPDEAAEDARRRGLPEHEIDEDATVGGGMMSQGGTAIDRGTGTLSGRAQGERDNDDAANPGFEADEADAALGRDR